MSRTRDPRRARERAREALQSPHARAWHRANDDEEQRALRREAITGLERSPDATLPRGRRWLYAPLAVAAAVLLAYTLHLRHAGVAPLFAEHPSVYDPHPLRGAARPERTFALGQALQVAVHPTRDSFASLIWLDGNEALWIEGDLRPEHPLRWRAVGGARVSELLDEALLVDEGTPIGRAALIVLLAPRPPSPASLDALPEELHAPFREGEAALESALRAATEGTEIEYRIVGLAIVQD